MSKTTSNLTTFNSASLPATTPTQRVWHLDVPLTYPAPPIGQRLTRSGDEQYDAKRQPEQHGKEQYYYGP